MPTFPGIIPAVMTPFDADDHVDVAALHANVRHLLDRGVHGLVAAVPGIVAVKECSGDARRIPALLHATEVEVLVGGDDWALEGFATGATGWVSGVANVAPEACVALWDQVAAGDLPAARETY